MKTENKNTRVNMISAPAVEVESPIFKTVNNKDYILYGQSNNYPSILKEMMNTSSLHSAILKKKSDMSAGKGWSTSIGGTYKKMKEDVSFYIPHSSKTGCNTPNYEYKVGVSLLDIGYINFNNNSQAATFDETLTTDEAENVFDGKSPIIYCFMSVCH